MNSSCTESYKNDTTSETDEDSDHSTIDLSDTEPTEEPDQTEWETDDETEEVDGYDIFSELGDEEKPEIMEKINESLDMFKRFKKYN